MPERSAVDVAALALALTPQAVRALHRPLAAWIVAAQVAGRPVDPEVLEVFRAVEAQARSLELFHANRGISHSASEMDTQSETAALSSAMTTPQVAELLGLTTRRVVQLGHDGLGSKIGARWRYPTPRVEAFHTARQANRTPR